MNLTALLQWQQENSGAQVNNINILLAKALIFVIENYFLALAPSFVLTLSCRNNHTCKFYDEMLEIFFQTWYEPAIQIVNIPKNGATYVKGRRHCNLILVDSYEAFRAIDVISYTANYNNNEYYYIFLQMRDRYLPAEMLKIFDYCWQNHLINCNIQIQTAKGEILIYTYYPYTPESCGNTTSILINQFNGTALVNEVLFPKKLTNFYGCTLRAALWDVPPFLYLKNLRNNDYHTIHGIEARVMLALAEKLNFSIEIKTPPNNEQRGVVNGNNLTGALLMLNERTADFSLGCFRLAYDRALVATATFSYYQSTQIVCFPLSAYSFSSLDILLFPFAASTWTLIFLICGMCVVMISIINRYHKLYPELFPNHIIAHSYLNIFLMAIGSPATSMPGRLFARLLCTNWMLFMLILRTAYQALLFHLIRTQATSRLPQSVNELVDDNYTVAVNHGTYLALLDVQFLKDLDLYVINDKEETVAFEYIEKYSRKNLVAVGPLDFLIYYGIEYKKAGVFRLLSERILSLPLTMYLTKHSFLVDQFDEELMTIRSVGLINIWSRWELDIGYVRQAASSENKIFGFYELHMLFVIGLIGMSIAAIVFILEILSSKISFLKSIFLNI